MIKYLLLLALLTISLCSASYKRVLLDDPQAVCLDGSPGAYYINEGDPKKFLIYYQGGGWCGASTLISTLENCYQRSKGAYGSSKSYSPTLQVSQGILSDSPKNPFKDWTKVFMKYCDGSAHQGSKSDGVKYKDTTLFFRGQNITKSQLQSIDKSHKLFTEATHVGISGDSAGGLAAYLWSNYIR